MGKPWFFAKINMKRKIRNTIIAFTLITSILCGNLFVSPVYAEEIENTADNVETLTLAEEETELQEEITEAENPDVDTIEEQENTDESVDEIEEDEKTDETDEIDETDETEKTDAVEDIPKESIIPEEIPSATETPVPTPEIEIKEDEEQIISVVKSDIDSDVYADAVAMVEEKYTGKALVDAFELSVPENIEFPVTITFSANIKADDNALLLQYTGSEWTEIVIDAVEDGSITATFDFLGSIIVLKDEIEEVVEEDQITEETLPLSYEKSIDNIEVSVSADAGVFPSGSTVLINKVNVSENIFTEENIQETYSFDITVVCNGEEVQPDTSKGNVTVSFAQIEIASDATVDVYHVAENLQVTSEKIQNVEVNDDNVSFQVEHFSVYTVIVSTKTYNSKPYYVNLSYALGEKIPLTEILDAAGVNYSDYVYINAKNYSADLEGQEYSYSGISYLFGTIDESYMTFNSVTIADNYFYLYKSNKTTKMSMRLFINMQNTTNHDFQLGEDVYADFDETTGHLDITGTGDMWGSCFNIVAPIADKIASISIAEGITSIGAYIFYGCANIKGELIIPDSVTSIGSYAFQNCTGFDGTLTLSNSLKTIGKESFYGCSGLTGNLLIPDSVTSIGNSAFKGCSGFTGNLVIPNGVTSIGDYVFQNCSGLTGDLVIPDSVTSIGQYAFSGCSGLTGDLSIPDSVTSIGSNAFYGCSGFTGDLVIPDGVTRIGNFTFYGCSGLSGRLLIPDSVTSIGRSALNGCSGLTGNLVIPDGVTKIEMGAFSGCSGLTGDLVIPDSVTSIEQSAFDGCSGFTGDLVIPDSITRIALGVFSGCSGFTGDLVIPSGVTSIESDAFSGCSGFTGNLVIPNGVTSIKGRAFKGCSGFTGDLVIPDSVTSIVNYAFDGCSSISNITIPNSVTSIGSYAFYSTNTVRTRLTTENSVAMNYNWAGSHRKLISDVTVTYHSNNADRGSVPVDSTVYETDDIVTVLGNTGMLEKDGLVFIGWNTSSDGTGTLYKEGETLIAEQSNIDLYAQFGNQPEEYTIKLPLELNMTVVENQFKGTADVAVDYYMESKKVNISVTDFDMTDSTGDKITVTASVTGNGWHNGNTDATYDDVEGLYHGTSHVVLTAPAKAGNYTGNLVFTITEENIGG